ncbi:MAG: hypothetical protein ACFFED_02880 [Candidatus Thorarchaeota archaeon]
MSWCAKVIKGKADEYVHAKLLKYGMGEHPGPRAFLKFSKARITFKADLDMEKVFIKAYVAGVPEGTHKIKGTIVTYEDRREDTAKLTMPVMWKVSKGKGATTYKAKLNEAAPLGDIKGLVALDDPTTFFLISLNPKASGSAWKITTKTSFPKGGPSDDEESEKDPVFSKGALENTAVVMDFLSKELFPDVADKIGPKTKSVDIRQTIFIDDIEIPDDTSLSFKEKRRLAKKRGRLIRKITIDGTDYENEYPFLA